MLIIQSFIYFYHNIICMDLFSPFIKINAPNDLPSPQKLDTTRQLPQAHQLRDMPQRKIGQFLIYSEKATEEYVEGYSVILLNNAIVYEGEMMRSRKNGYGVEYSQNGSLIYEGYFRDDKYENWGRTTSYTGQFRDGMYDGYGVYNTRNFYYQGFFQRGQPTGEGISFKGDAMLNFHPIKNIYEFLNMGLKNNMNILEQYKIEEIYLGEWKVGVKHGFGRLWKKNYWYSGQFSNDIPHGLGAEQVQSSKQGKQAKVAQTIYKLGVKK